MNELDVGMKRHMWEPKRHMFGQEGHMCEEKGYICERKEPMCERKGTYVDVWTSLEEKGTCGTGVNEKGSK